MHPQMLLVNHLIIKNDHYVDKTLPWNNFRVTNSFWFHFNRFKQKIFLLIFRWHEIGIYDLPATIDYVLNKTNTDKLHYVGHSQGTTSFFVMCSERPEYNKKIKIMVALAPSAILRHFKQPFLKIISPFYHFLEVILLNYRIINVKTGINNLLRI